MSWWSAPKSPPVAASGISPPALPSPLPSADSNGVGREAVSSLGRNQTGGTGRSHGSADGTQPQRKPSAIGQRRRTLENNAKKNVTAKEDRTTRCSTSSNGSGGGRAGNGSVTSASGRVAQKIPRRRQADTTNGACKTQSPSSRGVTVQKSAATPTTKTALVVAAKPKTASPRELSADNRATDGITMTVGSGWFDGLSSLVGLRPPTSIDLPPPTRKPTDPIPAVSANSAPARFSSAGTNRSTRPTSSTASPGSARKNQEQLSAEIMQKVASSKVSASPPPSLMPLHKKRLSSSYAANSTSPLSPSSTRLASKTKGSKSAKATPSLANTSAKTPIVKPPTLDKTAPSQSPKSGRRQSSSSMRSSRRPIKLLSATNRPTIASLTSRKIPESTRHGSVTAATKSTPPVKKKGRRKRHHRRISGEVIAALERDIFSGEDDDEEEEEEEEEEDVISVKEILREGLKTWKPSFLRSPPYFTSARTPLISGHSGLTHDCRNRHRGACGAGFDRDSRRRRRPSAQSEDESRIQRVGRQDRSRSQSRQRQRQERRRISTTQRTTSSASTETGDRTDEGSDRVGAGDGDGHHLSKREELERTMNTRVGRSSPSFGPSEGKGKIPTRRKSSRSPSSSPTSSPFSESKAATQTSSASQMIVKYDAPQKKLAKPSPARSTESSRTAKTIQTDEETPPSIPSRLSPSDCLEDLEAGQASSSPKLKRGKTDPLAFPSSAKEEEKQRRLRARQQFYANNFAVFAHGRLTTVAPVIFCGIALILSVVAKRSTTFVTLQDPLLVSPTFEKVDRVGLVFLDLCLADEIVTRDEGSGIETKVGRDYRGVIGRSSPHLRGHDAEDNVVGRDGFSVIGNLLFSWANPTSIEEYDQIIENYDHDDYIFVGPSDDEFETDMAGWDEHISVVNSPKICRSIKITSSTLTDTLWHISRTFLSLAIGFGFFLSFMLTSAAYWSTINLKPVAVGLLLTYFFQSMTFFFFDSSICRQHHCKMSSGAAAAVVASIFWFAAALGTIWMDMVFVQKKRRRERRERRRRRRERRRKRRREARAAFEAIKKKVALDLMETQHSGESASICSALSDGDDDYEEYDDIEQGFFRIMRDLGLDGDNSEDDEWVENDCSVGDEGESILHDANVFSAISFRQ